MFYCGPKQQRDCLNRPGNKWIVIKTTWVKSSFWTCKTRPVKFWAVYLQRIREITFSGELVKSVLFYTPAEDPAVRIRVRWWQLIASIKATLSATPVFLLSPIHSLYLHLFWVSFHLLPTFTVNHNVFCKHHWDIISILKLTHSV